MIITKGLPILGSPFYGIDSEIKLLKDYIDENKL